MSILSSARFLCRVTSQLQCLALKSTVSSEPVQRDPIVSGRYPNTFGTLGDDVSRTRTNLLPEEDGDVERVEFLDGVEGKTRLPLVKYSYLIKKHLDKKRLKDALDVLDVKMKNEHVRPDKYIYNLLISGCANVGYTKKAFQLFNQMKKRAIQFSGSTYTSLMNACANSPFPEDGLERAIRLRELMKEKGHLPDTRTCHAMIKAFGRCGDLQLAFNVVDDMVDRKLFMGCSTYNFLLQACASDKNAGFRHALLVWRKMLAAKVKPDYYSFNILLRCARDCDVGDTNVLEDVRSVAGPPRKNRVLVEAGEPTNFDSRPPKLSSSPNDLPANVQPDQLVLPNLLLPNPQLSDQVALGQVKKPWDRLALIGNQGGFLDTMVLAKAQPDIKTFTLLLETIEPTKEAEQQLLDLMQAKKVKLDVDFCNLLIKKRAYTMRYDEAWEAFKLIKSRVHKKPNLVTFGVLALATNGNSQTKEVIRQLEEMGYRVNIEILGSLLMKAARYYDLKTMRFVVTKLKQEKVKPNNKFFKHWQIFQERVEAQRKKSQSGFGHVHVVDEPTFDDEYLKLCDVFTELKNNLEDNEAIHPWAQFRQTKAVGT